MPKSWVVLNTGSNQAYIFQSNRQRYSVGASEILRQLPHWANNALEELQCEQHVDTVVSTSGTVMLLAESTDIGKKIVSHVTETALTKAPGVDVWGYVEPEPTNDNPMSAERRQNLIVAVEQVRWARPAPHVRNPTYPFSQICSITGQPTTHLEHRPGEERKQPVSEVARAALHAAKPALQRFRGKPEAPHTLGDAVMAPNATEVRNKGWVAVVHADGNGIGDIIRNINNIDDLKRFSKALEEATFTAFKNSVTSTHETLSDSEGWLLPLILGGDDVTFICDARYAVHLTRAYLSGFEHSTAQHPGMNNLVPQGGLTASAGIAFVKPHYPFSAAYTLAEELAAEAKTVKKHAPGFSSWDFHVLHDTTARELAEIRTQTHWVQPPHNTHTTTNEYLVNLHAGPFVVNKIGQTETPHTQWSETRADTNLMELLDHFGTKKTSPLSGAALQKLREAVQTPGTAPYQTRQLVELRSAHPGAATVLDQLFLHNDGDAHFTTILTLLDLLDVAEGTAHHRETKATPKELVTP